MTPELYFSDKNMNFRNRFWYGIYCRVYNRFDKKRKKSNIKCGKTLSKEKIHTDLYITINNEQHKILFDAFEIHMRATAKAKRIINKNVTQFGYKPNKI